MFNGCSGGRTNSETSHQIDRQWNVERPWSCDRRGPTIELDLLMFGCDPSVIIECKRCDDNCRVGPAMSHSNSAPGSRRTSDSDLPESAPAPLKVLGSKGIFLAAPQPYFRQRWTHLFPTRRMQIVAAITVAVTIGIVLAWMGVTINEKWMYDIDHPSTSLSTEVMASIPAMPGMLTLWHADLFFNQTLENTLNITASLNTVFNPRTPLPTYIPPAPVPKSGYNFHEVYMSTQVQSISGSPAGGGPTQQASIRCGPNEFFVPIPFLMEFCIPLGQDGSLDQWREIVHGEQAWPNNFDSTMDTLCIQSYALLDDRAFVEVDSFAGNVTNLVSFNRFKFQDPFMFVSLMDLEYVRSLENNTEVKSPSITDVITANLWSRPLSLPYNHRHHVTARMSKTITPDKTESWHTDMEYGGSIRFTEAIIHEAWDDYFTRYPQLLDALQRDPNIDLNRTSPTYTKQYYTETCFGPSSLRIPVVTEYHVYGWSTFLADFGGLLSLLSILFMLLFPLSQSFILPRTFIGFKIWSLGKKICWDEDDGSEEHNRGMNDPESSHGEDHERSISGPNGSHMNHSDSEDGMEMSYAGKHNGNGNGNSSSINPRESPRSSSAASTPRAGSIEEARELERQYLSGSHLEAAKVTLLEQR